MHIIKSVGVLSAAKIFGLLYGGMGLIFVPIFLLVGGMGALIGRGNESFGGVFFFILAILLPVIYGAIGFLIGALGALLYNVAAGWVGGFELELSFPEDVPINTVTPSAV